MRSVSMFHHLERDSRELELSSRLEKPGVLHTGSAQGPLNNGSAKCESHHGVGLQHTTHRSRSHVVVVRGSPPILPRIEQMVSTIDLEDAGSLPVNI